MKLCINCMYFMHQSSKCGRASIPDPVRGMPQNPFALLERTEGFRSDACGPEAKYFRLPLVAVSA